MTTLDTYAATSFGRYRTSFPSMLRDQYDGINTTGFGQTNRRHDSAGTDRGHYVPQGHFVTSPKIFF
jgi:hypothetical protein